MKLEECSFSVSQTYSMECIATQYPQHCRFKTIQMTVKETLFGITFDLTA